MPIVTERNSAEREDLWKRLMDLGLALAFGAVLSPLILLLSVVIWLQDRHSPFYIANRVGRQGRLFRMVKFRSMVIQADQTDVTSTSDTDDRITRLGAFLRRFKLDEIPQLWNILWGEMTFVGPRPNVPREVDLYSREERKLLSVRPGITDLASIVFADEGRILQDSDDPDLDYNLLIRPWKSRLGIHYVENRDLRLDVALMGLTGLAVLSREWALKGCSRLLALTRAPRRLVEIAERMEPLKPTLPPGVTEEEWQDHLMYKE